MIRDILLFAVAVGVWVIIIGLVEIVEILRTI